MDGLLLTTVLGEDELLIDGPSDGVSDTFILGDSLGEFVCISVGNVETSNVGLLLSIDVG
jgi:hypothetical protein